MKPLVPHELHSFAPVRATLSSDLATVAEPHESVIRDSHDRCLELGLNPRDHIDYSMETLADFKLAQERCAPRSVGLKPPRARTLSAPPWSPSVTSSSTPTSTTSSPTTCSPARPRPSWTTPAA